MLQGQFSFLHISDLHFSDESTSATAFRTDIARRLDNKRVQADCLVISGDLFNRGSLSRSQEQNARNFLNGLSGHASILVVPGNHDLDRMARVKTKDGWNRFLTRRSLVLEKSKKAIEGGEFSLSSVPLEQDVLYRHSFEDFLSFSARMGFASFNGSSSLDVENYEIQDIEIPFPLYGKGSYVPEYNVRFILLNTALIAGQSIHGVDYIKEYQGWKKAYQDALNDGDTLESARLRFEIAKQENFYMRDGELIVDDGKPIIERKEVQSEKSEDSEPESGRLSLSKEGNALLHNLPFKPNVVLTVFVGHHGFQFLASETQKAIKQAMCNCGSALYFCGHAHEARFQRFPLRNNTQPRDIEQFQAGRMFEDETNLTQCAFNHATFQVNDERLIGKIVSHFYIKSPSSEFRWQQEEISCTCPQLPPSLIMPVGKGEIVYPNPDEDEENIKEKKNRKSGGKFLPPLKVKAFEN